MSMRRQAMVVEVNVLTYVVDLDDDDKSPDYLTDATARFTGAIAPVPEGALTEEVVARSLTRATGTYMNVVVKAVAATGLQVQRGPVLDPLVKQIARAGVRPVDSTLIATAADEPDPVPHEVEGPPGSGRVQ